MALERDLSFSRKLGKDQPGEERIPLCPPVGFWGLPGRGASEKGRGWSHILTFCEDFEADLAMALLSVRRVHHVAVVQPCILQLHVMEGERHIILPGVPRKLHTILKTLQLHRNHFQLKLQELEKRVDKSGKIRRIAGSLGAPHTPVWPTLWNSWQWWAEWEGAQAESLGNLDKGHPVHGPCLPTPRCCKAQRSCCGE